MIIVLDKEERKRKETAEKGEGGTISGCSIDA
jgi:hypothetical protein